jgi:hypothetical protein
MERRTNSGHERQAEHFCCSGQKAIRWIRVLKRHFLGCNDESTEGLSEFTVPTDLITSMHE